MPRKFSKPAIGGGPGDMAKKVYDTDKDSVVDNAEKLEGSTKAQVQDHTPKAHDHTDLYKLDGSRPVEDDVLPDTDDAYQLGNAVKRFSGLYVSEDIEAGGINLLGDMAVTGTVDGVDVSAHAANPAAHHTRLHDLADALDHEGELDGSNIVESSIPINKLEHNPMIKIGDYTVSGGGAASVTFSSLDMEAEGPYLLLIYEMAGALGRDRRLWLNGDTTHANYYVQYFGAQGAALSGLRANQNSICVGRVNSVNSLMIKVSKVAGEYPLWVVAGNQLETGQPGSIRRSEFFGVRSNTENVTSITYASPTGNDILVGSRLILMRVV